MTITIRTASVDDHGRLMHAEDATAQACLAFVRLERELECRGLALAALRRLTVLSPAPAPDADAAEPLATGRSRPTTAPGDIVDLIRERLTPEGAHVPVDVLPAERLAQPGLLVALRAEVVSPPSTPSTTHEGTPMSASTLDVAALRDVSGLLLPGDAGYDEASTPWNLAFPLHPTAVAVPHSIDEVITAVTAAAELGLRVAPQSTGHLSSTLAGREDDTLLLRLHELTGVTVDPVARTARMLGGTLWRDVVAAAAPHGLTALHGSAGDVAVAGYVLGGGLSFYGRRHGLACSSVRAFEVVTADGALVRATADEHPDLFWALRGGGFGFGAVVAVELDLLPYADVYAGMLLWDLARGAEVLRAWAEWTSRAPESATTSIRFMRFPPIPDLPPFLSGRSLVVIDGAVLESDERAAELLAPLRALGPEMDTFGRMPAAGLLGVHMDPPAPTPGVSDHAMLTALPPEAIDALIAVAGPGADTPLMVAELRHAGGALDASTDAALPHLCGQYALFALSAVPVPDLLAPGEQVTKAVVDALRPWAAATDFPNFAERQVAASALYDEVTSARLTAIRDRYDPTRMWLAAHAV
ncbi:FAD-binding oxidoreductase [Humibacillus xanthopallidus]|uniref:FAD-binding oxidoreductase n=1 Tax=Humibacillus xanthopallidus TaxID=412689 RepID=UPI001C89E59B|nr:FAD-binding protein [Humibacillus xanthopallidus]